MHFGIKTTMKLIKEDDQEDLLIKKYPVYNGAHLEIPEYKSCKAGSYHCMEQKEKWDCKEITEGNAYHICQHKLNCLKK